MEYQYVPCTICECADYQPNYHGRLSEHGVLLCECGHKVSQHNFEPLVLSQLETEGGE